MTGRANLMVLTSRTSQEHHNQQGTALARLESTGELRGGIVLERDFGQIFGGGGGRIEVAFHNQSVNFDDSAWLHTSSKT